MEVREEFCGRSLRLLMAARNSKNQLRRDVFVLPFQAGKKFDVINITHPCIAIENICQPHDRRSISIYPKHLEHCISHWKLRWCVYLDIFGCDKSIC